jgi:mRNA interferase MazF
LALRRGDIVRIADGKPAVVVQWDGLPTPTNILVCPLTSHLIDAPTYRPTLEPDAENNLLSTSQVMVDRLGFIRRDRIDGVIGRLGSTDLSRLNLALAVVLDLGS